MALRVRDDLTLDDLDNAEAWIRCFSASARSKKLKDEINGSYEITDLFMAKAWIEAVKKISLMVYPEELENMMFDDIKTVVMSHLRPQKRLIIAERVRFLALKQQNNENIVSYAQRLREASRFCNFKKLGRDRQSAEVDLIQMRLIDGLQSSDQRVKALEMIQSGESPKLGACIDFIRQLEQTSCFSIQNNIENSIDLPSVNYIDKNKERMIKCKYCGLQHPPRKCPAFGKSCKKCGKLNHFKNVCKANTKYEKIVEEIENDDASVYSINMNDTNSEIGVKINDYNMKMQVDTGSQVTIIPINFWELMSKPKLQKCYLRLKQFDGTVIKVLGEFEATLETESKMNIVRIIVADCTKNHGLIGLDVLNINATKLVNSIKPLVHWRLINYKANILLKSGVQPTYFEARPLPIHIRPLVVDKLYGMIQQGLLQRVPPGGSRWASPLVVVRKTDGDLRICADYKIGVNQKLCSDSYPIPNIETVFHKMAGMKYFAKIDLKGAYHQIEMDKEAQEITTVNTPIRLLRWTCLPFEIKTASAIFQRAIESVVGDIIPNMIIFQDDICVGAKNAEELKSNLNKILSKLKESGMSINKRKKKGVTFEWRKEHQQAFELLKRNLCEEPVVKVYDINQDLELTTDASEKAISGILSQNGHPVLYLSRTLSDAETRYSNIEREASAIVWSAHRARHFLLGRKFKLISDHRPLEFIFESNKELPKVTSARILRWAIQMMAFDYEISYKKGENIPHADALSRLSFLPQDEEKDQETFIHLVESDIVNLEQIIKETENDRVLMDIKTRIRKNNWSRCSVTERPYKSIRNKLTIEKGIVCNGDLIVPPKTMRKIFIKSIHDDIHCGIM
nr:uncharacterized protein K02A2.6-like [Hydra vulgaris]